MACSLLVSVCLFARDTYPNLPTYLIPLLEEPHPDEDQLVAAVPVLPGKVR